MIEMINTEVWYLMLFVSFSEYQNKSIPAAFSDQTPTFPNFFVMPWGPGLLNVCNQAF